MAGLIIKLLQDRLIGEEETNLIHVQGDLIEMGPKKWPKQKAFIFFRQRNNKFKRN